MRSLSKKFRFGRSRSKTFSLDIDKADKLDKNRKRTVSVVLEDYKLNSETGWIQEDVKTDDHFSHRKEVEFSLSEDESDWRQTNDPLTIKQETNSNRNNKHNEQSRYERDRWTKDVIFEAEQLTLKAEIEQLRSRKLKKREESRGVLQRKGSNLDRWSSMPTILEHQDKEKHILTPRKHSTARQPISKISRKLEKFSSQSLDSLARDPSPSKQLKKSKSDRNTNEEGSLALIRAAKNNSVFQASSLIKHGISTEIQDQRGWTPLCIALEHGQLKCAEVLVRWKANVNFVHDNGTSILHHITSSGLYKAVRFLLRHGVEVNTLDINGWPAVHYGLQGGHFKCTALLLAAGCDTDYYTKKRIEEYKSAVKMSTVGIWRYQLHAQLDIDLDNQVDL